MKSKDQTLLEEAYTKINEADMSSIAAPGLNQETAQRYYNDLNKFKNGEITAERWYEICAKLLGDLMEKNKDVLVRLKNR
jgi:hypothetical protein